VSKVEEWKKMAAEYKNSSITLGTFGEEGAPTKSPSEPLVTEMYVAVNIA
jgi:hypothetical protein